MFEPLYAGVSQMESPEEEARVQTIREAVLPPIKKSMEQISYLGNKLQLAGFVALAEQAAAERRDMQLAEEAKANMELAPNPDIEKEEEEEEQEEEEEEGEEEEEEEEDDDDDDRGRGYGYGRYRYNRYCRYGSSEDENEDDEEEDDEDDEKDDDEDERAGNNNRNGGNGGTSKGGDIDETNRNSGPVGSGPDSTVENPPLPCTQEADGEVQENAQDTPKDSSHPPSSFS